MAVTGPGDSNYAHYLMEILGRLAMLEMMGHSKTVPGAILAADIPMALNRLKAAIDSEKPSPPVEDEGEDEPVVSMADRALPLINLLTAAAKAECNVMWK